MLRSTFSLMFSAAVENLISLILSRLGWVHSQLFTSSFSVNDMICRLGCRNCVPAAALDNWRLIRFVGVIWLRPGGRRRAAVGRAGFPLQSWRFKGHGPELSLDRGRRWRRLGRPNRWRRRVRLLNVYRILWPVALWPDACKWRQSYMSFWIIKCGTMPMLSAWTRG